MGSFIGLFFKLHIHTKSSVFSYAFVRIDMSFRVKPKPSEKDSSPTKMVDGAAMATPTEEKAGLKRQIGLLGTTSILIGTIIGSGIFASPSVVASEMGSSGATLMVWAGCGIIAMLSALCWMELGCMYPDEGGGEYTYIFHAFGPCPAFLYAYVNVLVTRPASLCIISLTCGDYIMEAFDLQQTGGFQYNKLIAAVLLGLLSIVFISAIFYFFQPRFQVFSFFFFYDEC